MTRIATYATVFGLLAFVFGYCIGGTYADDLSLPNCADVHTGLTKCHVTK